MNCGHPPSILLGNVSFATMTLGSIATYQCYSGYVFSDQTNQTMAQCSNKRQWILSNDLKCQSKCSNMKISYVNGIIYLIEKCRLCIW